jgi:hypothetical protein
VEGYFAETAAVGGDCHFLHLNLGIEFWGEEYFKIGYI